MKSKTTLSKRLEKKSFEHPLVQQQRKKHLAKKLLSEVDNDFEAFKVQHQQALS